MVRLVAILAAAVPALVSTAAAQLSPVTADVIINDHPDVVREGYQRERWHYEETLWRETLECWGDGSLLGAKATCVVCSIDKTAGVKDLRVNRPTFTDMILPSTSVGIQASHAYFSLRLEGWTLERYKPFAVNLYARSLEPYHRANVGNLSDGPAQRECRDMDEINGDTMVIRR